MSFAFRQRVEALRDLLLDAARNGFRDVGEHADLGARLRKACDRIAARDGDPEHGELRAWRSTLGRFEDLDADLQAVEVARGLRICQTMGGAAGGDRKKARGRRAPRAERVDEDAVKARTAALSAPTHSLPGIGPALSERLAERGIDCVEDLLWLVPRRYDDVRQVAPLGEALERAAFGERVTLEGVAVSCRFSRRGRRRWVDLRLCDAEVAEARLVVRWFNAHGSMTKRFPKGSSITISGRLEQRSGTAEMANPDVLAVTTPDGNTKRGPANIIPRYSDLPGVPAATLRKACAAAVERAGAGLADGVPVAVAERLGLVSLPEAIRNLHAPPDTLTTEEVGALNDGTSEWHRRLAFDELFVLGVAVARRRVERRADVAVPCPERPERDDALRSALPFALTDAQSRAIESIAADLARSVPMNRLLQGDVGSGKTAVAFAAAHQVVAAERQVALMAPTEILAEQHLATIAPWARSLGVRCALLTASTPRAVRTTALTMIAAGEIDFVIGTHALLAEGLVFDSLGLVVVDEQHRFGVAQRVRLRSKGDDGAGAPHLLVMTATPIPRTLALTAYGDLDVTVVDELPPGRSPARTLVVKGARGRAQIYRRLRARLEAGERAFVVCPLVAPAAEDERGGEGRADWADATSVAGELARSLAPQPVGLVHGRMSQSDREQVMARFRDGELRVLVATTVIEVGVDVPEATVMVVEDADHFALAQLHQLRGRVGRGGGESHCLLLTRGRQTETASRRLAVMAETTDGFRIAEEDLAIRGPGELLGVRQAGLPKLRFGDLRQHAELLLIARSEADHLLAMDPRLEAPEHAMTRAVLEMRAGGVQVYGAEGG